MPSTLTRKAWGDLARHRGRTVLAALTLGIAIATLGFVAVPGLLGAAMNRQVAASHLYDVGISTNVLNLTPAQLRALGRLPGVAAVSPVQGFVTKGTGPSGTANVGIYGGDLESAPVDTVPVMPAGHPDAVRSSPTSATPAPPTLPSRPAATSPSGPRTAAGYGCSSPAPG